MLKLELLAERDRTRLYESEIPIVWDAFVKARNPGCFMQSWAWANFRELEGYRTFRYGLFRDSAATQRVSTLEYARQLVGGCIFYLYPQRGRPNLLFAPGGPIFTDDWAEKGMQLLLQQVEELAREFGAIALRIEPLLEYLPDWLPHGFVRAPTELMPSESLWVNLCQPPDRMLAAMKPKGRYNLRLSWRYGVETEFTTDEQAIALFYDLFWETAQRQQFFGEPFGFFINLCQTLLRANMAEVGLARWQGELLGAILVVYWGDRCTYLYGGRSTVHAKVMASYALHWAAMQRAKERGCNIYDFYGHSDDPNHAYFQFSRFKSQFGGTVVKTIGAYDYFFYDRLADTMIALFKRL